VGTVNVPSSLDRARVFLLRRRGLAILACFFLLASLPFLGFRLVFVTGAASLRMLLVCVVFLAAAVIATGRVAAKVIDLVVGLANLTWVGASLEQAIDLLVRVLVLVRDLIVGRRR
jgi:hypothetical protein